MEQITLRVERDTLESLQNEASEHGISRSEHIRNVIDSRHETDELREEHEREVERMHREHAAEVRDLKERIDELETEIEHKDARINELENQLTARDNLEEKVDVLANRVEERERAADAPFPVRWVRWWRGRGEE